MNPLKDVIEFRFKEELREYFDDIDIIKDWRYKFTEYNPAFDGCSLQIRYLNLAYSDEERNVKVWEKRMSSESDYTFKPIIKKILEWECRELNDIIKEM